MNVFFGGAVGFVILSEEIFPASFLLHPPEDVSFM
jgi:hypothetical protein